MTETADLSRPSCPDMTSLLFPSVAESVISLLFLSQVSNNTLQELINYLNVDNNTHVKLITKFSGVFVNVIKIAR